MNSELANDQKLLSLKSLLKLLAMIDRRLSNYLYSDIFDDVDSSNLSPIIDYLAKLLSEETELDQRLINDTTPPSSAELERIDRMINHFEGFSSSRLSFRTIFTGAAGKTSLIGKKGTLAYKSFSLVISSCWIFHFEEFEKLVALSEDIYARIEAYEALKLIPRISELIYQIDTMEKDLISFSWGADVSELNELLLRSIKSNDQIITSAKILLGKKIEETNELCKSMSLPCKNEVSEGHILNYNGLELVNKVAILRSFGPWTEYSIICLSEVFDELIELVERLEGYVDLKEFVNYEQELDFLAYQPFPMPSRELIQASLLDPLNSSDRIISGDELPQLISTEAMLELDIANHPENFELVLSVEVLGTNFVLNVTPSIYEKELIIGETKPFHCNHSLTLPWISMKNDLLVFLGEAANEQSYKQTLFIRNYALSVVSEILTYAIKEANSVDISAITVIVPKKAIVPSEIELLGEMSGLNKESIKNLGEMILKELEQQVSSHEIFQLMQIDKKLIYN
ncbi:MAG: hypothetical protein ACTSYA_05945 [Candidatus Kariarchaeaceae archaeon]